MFKVGDLATVTYPATAHGAWPGAVVGDIVQITQVRTVPRGGSVGFVVLRTGKDTPCAWSANRFKPLASYPE